MEMKAIRTVAFLLVIGAAFMGGYVYKTAKSGGSADRSGRKVLYWVDPMHPAYKSDKPGIAPDCGMKLVPVYEEKLGAPAEPGSFRVSAEKQQLIGVEYGTPSLSAQVDSVRAVGRVAQDETRVT